MAAPTIYRSTDASAPTLDGQVGSLVTVLDACLVNGYGAKSAAGWTKAFSAANTASYKMGSPSAGVPPTQYYLDVDDSGPSAANEARIRGYETMTAVATGTNQFPVAGTNIAARKKSVATAGAVVWMVIADETSVYVFVQTGDTANTYMSFFFGEFYSYVSGDQYKCVIQGRTEASSSATGAGVNAYSNIATAGTVSAVQNNFTARNYTGLNIGSASSKTPLMPHASTNLYCGSSAIGYPNSADGSLLMSPVAIWTQSPFSLHGEMRGFFHGGHASSNFANGDTFSGSGALAGRTFIMVLNTDGLISVANTAYMIVETTAWPRSS